MSSWGFSPARKFLFDPTTIFSEAVIAAQQLVQDNGCKSGSAYAIYLKIIDLQRLCGHDSREHKRYATDVDITRICKFDLIHDPDTNTRDRNQRIEHNGCASKHTIWDTLDHSTKFGDQAENDGHRSCHKDNQWWKYTSHWLKQVLHLRGGREGDQGLIELYQDANIFSIGGQGRCANAGRHQGGQGIAKVSTAQESFERLTGEWANGFDVTNVFCEKNKDQGDKSADGTRIKFDRTRDDRSTNPWTWYNFREVHRVTYPTHTTDNMNHVASYET